MTAATSLGLAEGTPWRRGRNTQFNMKLSAYILVPFTTLVGDHSFHSERCLGG
jgi:hypothetical protein